MISAGCPPATLPDDDGTCVHLPAADEGGPPAESSVNSHRDRRGDWVVYDQIPRRPERPADYGAYRYPIACEAGCAGGGSGVSNATVVSGYDLDRPDEQQRRGSRLRYVGHGAVDLSAPRGTPVQTPVLEHQQGPAQVVYVGWLFGNTVVTRHVLLEGGEARDYLVVLGHLDETAPGLVAGHDVREGDVVGLVGDSGSKGLVHLHLEVRRWRSRARSNAPGGARGPDAADAHDGDKDPLTVAASRAGALVSDAESVVCDPRNVLPLR
jgi:murein DD-endopeptidase MepM/ murein hydrolase activator NlpD